MPKGGAREGAGRKPQQKSWSDKFKAKLWRSLEKEAKKQGMTVFEVFAKRFYDSKIQDSVFASLWKSLCDVMAAKESRTTVEEHKFTGPVIGLPPIKPRPTEENFFIDVTKKKELKGSSDGEERKGSEAKVS